MNVKDVKEMIKEEKKLNAIKETSFSNCILHIFYTDGIMITLTNEIENNQYRLTDIIGAIFQGDFSKDIYLKNGLKTARLLKKNKLAF